jgi:hypothetical protein
MEKRKAKRRLFAQQRGKCFYCQHDTWMPSEGKLSAAARLGFPTEGHGWTKPLRRRMATIEHLHRRADGGPNKIENYVVACHGCNSSRGGRKVEDHRAIMSIRPSITLAGVSREDLRQIVEMDPGPTVEVGLRRMSVAGQGVKV